MLDLNGGTCEERLAKLTRWVESHDAQIKERWTSQFALNTSIASRLDKINAGLEARMKIVILSMVGSLLGGGLVSAMVAVLIWKLTTG